MNYQFPTFNIVLVDPQMEIKSDNLSIFPSTMTIAVDLVFTTSDGSEFGFRLEDISVNDFNYDGQQLYDRVMTRLADYAV